MPLNFNKAEFVRSAGEPKDFLRDGLPQFAFAGRSNVGKSSVINRLVGRKNLAYVGASPGKTTHINYFLIDQKAYLVDLPGYGYAKVSRSEKERWARLMETYFQREADAITTGVLIVDIRHKPTANDLVMHDWFRQTGCPEIVVANKLDKLKKSQVEPALELIRETLELTEEDIQAAEAAARDYYAGTVFTVEGMEYLPRGSHPFAEGECNFTVTVRKDGAAQEDRLIQLDRTETGWTVVNEGY